ncbi:MAG: hypothetical protein Q9215_006635 [Flavoplaca cf. flavocitrina]
MGQTVSKVVRKVPVTEGWAYEDIQEVSITDQPVSKDDQVVPFHTLESTASQSYQLLSDLQHVVPMPGLKSTWSPSEQIQDELQQPAEISRKETFPFEKLPPELQLAIIRFAMPSAGIKPAIRYHQRKLSYSAQHIVRSPCEGTQLPLNLFLTSKSISAMALPIFYSEVPLQIFILTWVVWFAQEKRYFRDKYFFTSHLQIHELPQFRLMRNYHINFPLDDWWFEDFVSLEGYHQHCLVLKERLRLVCDALANNHAIQRLTVTVPCLCCLARSGCHSRNRWMSHYTNLLHKNCSLSQTYPKYVDFLSPLKRIKVAKAVVFEVYHDIGTGKAEGDAVLCNDAECMKLVGRLDENMGYLNGEYLPYEEEAWRRIKGLDHGNTQMWRTNSAYMLTNLWHTFNKLQSQGFTPQNSLPRYFAVSVEKARIQMLKDHAVWQRAQAKKRRQESLRQYNEKGLPAEIWSDELQRDYEDLSLRKRRNQEEENWLMIFKEIFESRRRAYDPLILE